MATIDEVIEKVRKLRKLAGSDNVNEAAAAAAAADRLIQEHGLAEAQLEAEGQAEGEAPAEDATPGTTWYGQTVTWQLNLISGLARHYGCSSYLITVCNETEAGVYKHGRAYKMIGRPSDVASVRYMYAWLVAEIEGLAQKNTGNGRAWLNSFRIGCVVGVVEAMRAEKRAVIDQARAAGASAAIVLVENRLAEAKAVRDAKHPDLKSSGNRRGPSDLGGFFAGQKAGRDIHARGNRDRLGAGGHKALKG
jgi:hypothetical protein